MSINSSSNCSLCPPLDECITSTRHMPIFTAFFITYILLLLPLFILVFCVGYERWRKQHSGNTTSMLSHSDIFTFNMLVLEMMGLLGSCLYCYATYNHQLLALAVGVFIYSIILSGQILFHLLTCVERYLAVVHPVTYMGLRQSGGVRIRNISIGCVWLFSFVSAGVSLFNSDFNIICIFVILVVSSVVVSFCSLSVLCVLIRPGPGEVGGNKEKVDQSKQRAFYTIMVITGALLLRLFSTLVCFAEMYFPVLSSSSTCLVWPILLWLSLPSSLVLPLLFLQRAGKLPGCKHNSKAG